MPTGIGSNPQNAPELFSLEQNYPNPFNPTTSIKFRIMDFGLANPIIYNLQGRKVKTLGAENLAPGVYEIQWNGTDETRQKVGSGMYINTLKASGRVQTRKMLLLR